MKGVEFKPRVRTATVTHYATNAALSYLKPAYCYQTEVPKLLLYPTMTLFLATTKKIKFYIVYIPPILIYFFNIYPTFLQDKSSLPVTLVLPTASRIPATLLSSFSKLKYPHFPSTFIYIPSILQGPVCRTLS